MKPGPWPKEIVRVALGAALVRLMMALGAPGVGGLPALSRSPSRDVLDPDGDPTVFVSLATAF
jgi:hypothetical protein